MKKRFLASLLSLALLLALLPVSALATEEPGEETVPVCAALESCGEDAHGEGCPLHAAPDNSEDGDTDAQGGEISVDPAADSETDPTAIAPEENSAGAQLDGLIFALPVSTLDGTDTKSGLYSSPAPLAANPITVGNISDLEAALTTANADAVIQLTGNIGDESNRLSGVTVNKNITLDLNGHTLYVTGNQTSSSVNCAITQTAGSLTVTSTNGKGAVNCAEGGFIKQTAANVVLAISNVDFSCETTTSSMLYLRAMTETTLTDCNFTGGKGVPYKYSSYNGSVSYSGNAPVGKDSKTKLTVTDCNFINNHTGIALSVGSDYEINVTDSNFTGCDFGISQDEGNKSLSSDLKMNISGTTFSENSHGLCLTSTSYNKTAAAGSRNVTITGCTFENNEVLTPVKINGNNVGGKAGAGIYYKFLPGSAPYYDDNYTDNLTISGCTFTGNHAGQQGGAIYIDTTRLISTATITGCTFTENEAGFDGAAVFFLGNIKNLTIADSTIQDSISTNAAVAVASGEINLRNSNIINNNGDGISVSITNDAPANVTLEGVKVEGNDGCGVFGSFTSLTVKDSATTTSSISSNEYGGMDFSEGAVTIQGNTKIENNTSPGNGAGIYMSTGWAENASLSIRDNVIIQGNSTSNFAGGIYAVKGTLDVDPNVILCNNTSDKGGADIWYMQNVTPVHLPDPATMHQEYKADDEHQMITGWYKDWDPRYADADPKVPYDYTQHIGTGDVLLIAAYTPVTKYNVTFDLNYEGATGAPEAQKIEAGQKASQPTPAPTREGYVFDSWYTGKEDAGGNISLDSPYNFDTPVNADITLYAKWTKEYTVTYDLGDSAGAEGENYGPLKVRDGDSLTLAAAPTRDSYTFTGWSDGMTTYKAGDPLIVTGNITLTAQWSKNGGGEGGGSGGGGDDAAYYTLHYESNGGTKYWNERYAEDTVVKLNKFPTREGYVFTGWYADEELTEPITSVKMAKNKTVYAGWRAATVPDLLNGSDHFAYVVGYPDGTVRPMKNISRAQVATIFFRLLQPEIRAENLTVENTFADVNEGMWCNTAVSTMARLGIVTGRTTEKFDPNAAITRGEFAVICARFDASRIDGGSNFTDIANHWAKAGIERAVSLGWIRGYTDGTFRPNQSITRAEAMTMINRMLCRIPENEDDLLPDMNVWLDNQPGDGHYLAVQEATNSHDFQYKGEIYEYWTGLNADPDWTRYQD